jgi:hypothetical protein
MTAPAEPDVVVRSVAALAPLFASAFRDPWWLIGSAAMHLAGEGDAFPHDIDVLTSERDAEAFIARHGELLEHEHRPADGERFRSRFARFGFSPLPVELMGDLQVWREGEWRPVRIEFTRMIDCAGHSIAVPTLAEQLRLFEWFGRAKDLDKARRLRDRMHAGDLHVA